MRTWVCWPSTVMVGRNVRGTADLEVGETSSVESRRSSDCTTTANRAPRCSWTRVFAGARSRWMSPRTKLIHLGKDAAALDAVCLVVQHGPRFGPHLFAAPEPDGVDECLSDRLRRRLSIGHQLRKCPFGSFVGAEVDDSHGGECSTDSMTLRLRRRHGLVGEEGGRSSSRRAKFSSMPLPLSPHASRHRAQVLDDPGSDGVTQGTKDSDDRSFSDRGPAHVNQPSD